MTLSLKELVNETRNYFLQIRKLKLLLKNTKEIVDNQKTEIENFGSMAKISYKQAFSDSKSNKDRRSPETTLLTLKELEERYNQRLITLTNIQKQAFDLIGNVEDFEQQNILISRYLMGKEWEDICIELDVSEKWALKLHKRALENFATNNFEFMTHWKDIFKSTTVEGSGN